MSIIRFLRDQYGGPLVEAALLIPLLFTFSLGAVDFLFLYYQWNAATKAVELGSRIAAVSDPVASGLNAIACGGDVANCSTTVQTGNEMTYFQVTCDGNAKSCNCTGGTCTGLGAYSAVAMNKIVYGRNSTATTSACNATPSTYYFAGMCNIFSGIAPANVKIVYTQTGLGYLGRVAGPVPTISIWLQNVPVQFFFLGGLLAFTNSSMPTLSTTHTITGEALWSGPCPTTPHC